MQVTVLDEIGPARRAAPEWAALAERAGAAPCARPAWCLPWWEHLGRGRLHVVTVRRGGPAGPLVAVGPFHLRRRGRLDAVRFLGHGLGALSAPVVDPEHPGAADALWAEVLSDPARHLQLCTYDARDPSFDALSRAGGPGLRVRWEDVCPTIDVEGGLDDHLASRPELRRVLRRARRALDRRGSTYGVEAVTDADRAGRVIGELTAVHDAAEADRPRQHLLADRLGSFTRDLILEAAGAGTLHLSIGRVDGRAVAFALCLRGPGGPAMWLNRFDPSFSDVSPGHLLIEELVRSAHGAGDRLVDLMIGDFRYKRLWSTGSHDTLTVEGSGRAGTAAIRRVEITAVDGAASAVRRAREAWRARGGHDPAR